jgi:PTH1 family peptidyl-tRNA hydrolase
MSFAENEPRVVAVVGLGNPGPAYASTRHNAGFMVVDELARRLDATSWTSQGACRTAAARVDGHRVWFAKPTTYMNRSGSAVESLVNDLEIEHTQLLVVVDDIDLAIGRLRLRRSGGPGTHNGLRDIVAHIGSDFARLRVGVGASEPVDELADFVLSPFDDEELETVEETLKRAVEAALVCLAEGLKPAMDRFNRNSEPEGEQETRVKLQQ